MGRRATSLCPFPVSIMKFFISAFFKTLRVLLGPVMLLREMLTRPSGLVRQPVLQAAVDAQCRSIVLYQYKTCPFCIKVRQEMRHLSLKIERRDAQKEGENRADLVHFGGQAKVPCLKITDQSGDSRWMYDSSAIVAYLRGRFASD